MNTYIAELKNDKGSLVWRISVEKPDRAKAVNFVEQKYWAKFKGKFGPAHKVLHVSDPTNEVVYNESFRCTDKKNLLLPESVVERLIRESCGELERDTRESVRNHAKSQVKRVKRRRDFGKFIAPSIKQMKNGVLYYRITIKAQKSKKGALRVKRKYKDVRLMATDLSGAMVEIHNRGLKMEHERNTKRTMKSRSLKLLAHIIGVKPLNDQDKFYFFRPLKKYEGVQTRI